MWWAPRQGQAVPQEIYHLGCSAGPNVPGSKVAGETATRGGETNFREP